MHNNTMKKKRRAKILYKKYLPLTLLQVFEKGYSWFACERELETEQKLQYSDPLLLWPSTLCLSHSPDAQTEALGPFCWVIAFFTASYHQFLWSPNSIGVPEGPFGRVWLSLPHLVYLRLQLYCNWLSN